MSCMSGKYARAAWTLLVASVFTMVGFQFGTIHARAKNGMWTFWAEQHDSEHGNGLVESRVAVLIIGSARTLVWPAVCQNMKTNLVDGLRQHREGSVQWHVDVFLFISLTDAGPKGHNVSGQRHDVNELRQCKEILKPVHIELMPETYPMPKHEKCLSEQDMPQYSYQTSYWHVANASERKYSQCRRVVEAFTYVEKVYEPATGIRYDAWVRARSDSVYLAPVPSMADFDLRKLTSTSLAMVDHWHLVSRNCKTTIPFNCIKCVHSQFDECPNRPEIVRSFAVQAVVAREKDVAWLRKTQGITQLAARPKPHEKQGYLFLECDRWLQECARQINTSKVGNYTVNGSWHSCDPSPCRKMQLEFLKAELPSERIERRVAVLIIGSARTLVWPAVCQNMKANLVDGLRQHRVGSVQWHVDVFLFISLTDAGPKGHNVSGQRHDVNELRQCKEILKPVHIELMPEAYPMPKHESCLSKQDMPNYWNDTTYWNVSGASERRFSQCRRVVEAFTYVEKVYEPLAGIRYDAWVRARSDSVYLAPVPSMADFDLRKLTSTSLAMVDHWHLVSRNCKTALPFSCIKCKHSQFDDCPSRPKVVRSFAVQPVVAREKDAAWLRKAQGITQLPARPKPHEKQGYLFLECHRWNEECAIAVNLTKAGKQVADGAWRSCDPSPCRKMQLEFLKAPLPRL
ncbi:unnamed protein product [Symbiodinium sp. CCMP2456]|nr:unnamed protein product [Symbiodinium sp. CCMP2456]